MKIEKRSARALRYIYMNSKKIYITRADFQRSNGETYE